MASLTKISFLLKKGRRAEANRLIEPNEPVVSANVGNSAAKTKMFGTVVHVSKAKTIGFSKNNPSNVKKSRHRVTYYRLVFCRYDFSCVWFMQYRIMCKRGSAKQSVKDDHAFQ
jgi:hypothetical protein